MSERKARSPGVAVDESVELMYWGMRVFTAGPDAVLAARGLGRVHHRVLYCVAKRPGIRVGELADVLGISRQALHRTLRELVDRALIESERAEESARERALVLTREGAELERRLATEQRKRLLDAERALGAEAMASFRDVMRFIARPGIEASPEKVAHLLEHLLPAGAAQNAPATRHAVRPRPRAEGPSRAPRAPKTRKPR